MNLRDKKVVYVDGFLIRNTLDDDFCLIHERSMAIARFSPKYYIPADEIWLDQPYRAETDFLLAVEAFPLTLATYAAQREKLKEQFCTPLPTGVTLGGETSLQDGIKVVLVDGSLVRRHYDPEFFIGGHDLVYLDYIPANEIWLDKLMDPREMPFILIHEQVERRLMSEGKSYDVAHEFAIAADKEARRTAGFGHYPGDATYPWRGLSNEEIIAKYYVH